MADTVVETDKQVALTALRWIVRAGVGEDKLQASITLISLGTGADVELGYEKLREIAQATCAESYRAAHHLLAHAREE